METVKYPNGYLLTKQDPIWNKGGSQSQAILNPHWCPYLP